MGALTAQALSPWPTSPVANTAAIARLASALVNKIPEAEVNAIGCAAAARVEREAPGAPQGIRDEATIRYAGYLTEGSYGAIRKRSIGPIDYEFVVNHANAWRNCGAAGLLAPWRIRRAGVIG